MKVAQDGFIKRFSDKWVSSFLVSRSGTVVMETATSVTTTDQDGGGAMIMEELVRIFREANQLRMDTITSIVGELDRNQLALFLDSVCKFLAGFKHQDQAFQNSLFHYHLINQQLPKHEQLFVNPFDTSGEVNYPPPMTQQRPPLFPPFAPSGLVPSYPPPQHYAPLLPPDGHPRFPPSGLVIPHQNYHPPMMQQYAPQPPPPPMNQQLTPEQCHVIYVGNLAPEATDELLLQEFSRYYYSVRDTKICVDGRNGYKYGFVSFADEREKMHAVEVRNGQIFLDWPMHIGPAAKNSL